MTDEDDTKPHSEHPYPPSPLAAVYQALADVQTDGDQLDLAVQKHGVEDAQIAAIGASSSLLAAVAALRRLDEKTARVGRVLAQIATGAAHRRVIAQFTHAAEQIESSQLRSLLRRLRIGLALACGGEPPPSH